MLTPRAMVRSRRVLLAIVIAVLGAALFFALAPLLAVIRGRAVRIGACPPPSSQRPCQLRAESVAVLASGRILVAGVSLRDPREEDCVGDLVVVGLDARGRVDPRVGEQGTTRILGDDGCVKSVPRLAQDRAGRTLAEMTVFHPSDSAFEDESYERGHLTRLTPAGRVDDSFNDDQWISGFAVSPDGSIFNTGGDRFLPDGDRDPRDDGAPVENISGVASDVAAQPDGGKLFFGAGPHSNDISQITVQRFTTDWRPDTSFANNGTATADIPLGANPEGTPELLRVLAAPEGAVIASGRGFGPRGNAFAIRFDAAGRVDRGFGDRGRISLGPASSRKDVYDVAVASDGSLVALGSTYRGRVPRLFVARYDARGRPDRRFGRAGRVTLDILRVPRGTDASDLSDSRADGAIADGPGATTVGVASLDAGYGRITSVAFRLRPDGKLDHGFGRRGVRRLERLG